MEHNARCLQIRKKLSQALSVFEGCILSATPANACALRSIWLQYGTKSSHVPALALLETLACVAVVYHESIHLQRVAHKNKKYYFVQRPVPRELEEVSKACQAVSHRVDEHSASYLHAVIRQHFTGNKHKCVSIHPPKFPEGVATALYQHRYGCNNFVFDDSKQAIEFIKTSAETWGICLQLLITCMGCNPNTPCVCKNDVFESLVCSHDVNEATSASKQALHTLAAMRKHGIGGFYMSQKQMCDSTLCLCVKACQFAVGQECACKLQDTKKPLPQRAADFVRRHATDPLCGMPGLKHAHNNMIRVCSYSAADEEDECKLESIDQMTRSTLTEDEMKRKADVFWSRFAPAVDGSGVYALPATPEKSDDETYN